MAEDSEPMPLGDRRAHRKWLRFDPTLSSGQIANLIVLFAGFVTGYATYISDRATGLQRMAQIEKDADEQKKANAKALDELKLEVRQVQTTVISVDKSISGIQAVLEMKKKDSP